MKISLILFICIIILGCSSLNSDARSGKPCFKAESCDQLIYDIIQANWLIPENVKSGLVTGIRIELNDSAEVQSVIVIKPSSNDQMDESLIQAVKESSPFIELFGLADNEYQAFKSFEIGFISMDE